jgi:uncharacterized membrane protein YqjE
MKLNTKEAEGLFLALFVIVLLIIIPMWGETRGKYAGGIAMLAVLVLGLVAYIFYLESAYAVTSAGQRQQLLFLPWP